MSDKNDVEKQVDPRKEILFRQIGAKIAYYRTLRDRSQKELAKRANMSVSSLSKIERGRYNDNISVSLLFDIADGLQIDITMLVTFSDMVKSMWWKPLSKDWKIFASGIDKKTIIIMPIRTAERFFVDRVKKMSVNEESSYEILANNIYKFRVLNNLSQKELAEKSNVSTAYISQIENCRSNKGIASLIKMAQALQVPLCILFAEESCPKYLQCLERVVSLSNGG